MSLNPLQARDEIFALLKSVWDEGLPADFIDTRLYPVSWPGVPFDVPVTEVPWIRVHLQHVNGNQSSLTNGTGRTKYARQGFITVQIFVPVGLQDRMTVLHGLVKLVMSAFEGRATENGVWFRNVRFIEAGIKDSWDQINVIADFNYEEVK